MSDAVLEALVAFAKCQEDKHAAVRQMGEEPNLALSAFTERELDRELRIQEIESRERQIAMVTSAALLGLALVGLG